MSSAILADPAARPLAIPRRPPVASWGDAGAVFLIALCAVLASAWADLVAYDDAYITYRYSRNFATGQGFVYNAGERYLGTTAPFYALLLGVLGLPKPALIPHISLALSGVSYLLGGLGLYAYARNAGRPFCGLLAGLFWCANFPLWMTFGGEMLFQFALILWAFVFYQKDRLTPTAVLLALAMLTRPDGILATAVLGLHYVVTRRRFPWREAAVITGLVLPFLLLSWWYYGTPLPGTLEAKIAQRAVQGASFIRGTMDWLGVHGIKGEGPTFSGRYMTAVRPVLAGLVAIGVLGLLRYRFWLLPVAWAGTFTLCYMGLRVPFYHWYMVPVVFIGVVLLATGIATVCDGFFSLVREERGLPVPRWQRRALYGAILLLLAPAVRSQIVAIRAMEVPDHMRTRQYYEAARWFAASAPPRASVGCGEIGWIGYHIGRRPIVDPMGLITPGAAPHIARKDVTWAFRRYRPDFILDSEPTIFVNGATGEPLPGMSWFRRDYRIVYRIAGDRAQSRLPQVIYKKIGPAASDGYR